MMNPERVPSRRGFLGGLRSSVEDEFGFWTLCPNGIPRAVPPFSLSFSTAALGGHALLVCDEEGIITILDSRRSFRSQMGALTPKAQPYSRFRGHDNAIFDATWLEHDENVATAGGDTTVRIFDARTTVRKAVLRGASGSIKSVRPCPQTRSVLVSASRDGNVRIYDTRAPAASDIRIGREPHHYPVATITQPHAASREPDVKLAHKRRRVRSESQIPASYSVTAVAFHPGRALLYTAGASDGTIKLWDLRMVLNRPRADGFVECATPGMEHQDEKRRRTCGIASLDIDISGQRVLASTTDSRIYLYLSEELSGGHTQILMGHLQTSFYIRAKFSSCGSFVASGSADSKAYIWDVASGGHILEPMLELDGHRGGEVSAVDWCRADSLKLATCADDSTAKIWQVANGEKAAAARKDGELVFNGARRIDMQQNASTSTRWEEYSVRRPSRRRLKNADIRSFFSTS